MSDYIRRDAAIEALRNLPHEYKTKEQRARTGGIAACQVIIENLPGIQIEDAAKHEPKLETATIGGWDPVKRFDEIFRKKEGD